MSISPTKSLCHMESKEVNEAEKGDRMVSCDLEAAETLAGLARCSSVRGGSQPTVDGQRATSSGQGSKAEKEARRIRRILANRESARQTIRRRQAMYLAFMKKVAELAEENESLKKEKELAVKDYNSLKDKNEFLKLQMSKMKKADSRQAQEEPEPSGETANSVNTCTPSLPYNQPLFVPFFWPSVAPSSDLFQTQYASHPKVGSSLQFPPRHYGTPFIHHGQESCTGNTGSGNPVFMLPVPWLLPCVGHCNALHMHSHASERPRETSAAHQHSASLSSDHHLISSKPYMGMEASSSSKFIPAGSIGGTGLTFQADSGDHAGHHCYPLVPEVPTGVKSAQSLRPQRSLADNMDDLSNISAPEHLSLQKVNQEKVVSHNKRSKNVVAATEARQKRKELMRLKNIHFPHSDFVQYR